MATDDISDEILEAGEEEARLHSEDWRLVLHEDEYGFLCDFNGWPGDNENGAGYYYEKNTGKVVVVFTNSDTSLSARISGTEGAVEAYEKYRLGY